MKKATLIVTALASLLCAACQNSGMKRTKSGLMYKIISDGKGKTAEKGNIMKLHFKQTINNDTVLSESYSQMPFYTPVDSVGPVYSPAEIFTMLRKGDSVVIVQMADSLVKKQGPLPDFIKTSDKLVLSIKVLDIFTVDSLAQADRAAAMTAFQEKQQKESVSRRESSVKDIEAYLKEKNLQYVKAPKGTYIVIKEQGTGPKADSGKIAQVLYRGYLFPSMEEFETNMTAGKEPYPVKVGTRGVIEGWDEALPYFNKGGKGTLYIPFFLAYGSQAGPKNTPFANLVFDIEIADVQEDTAAAK